MQVTQLFDPFNFKVSGSKGNIWLIIIILGVVASTIYYLYRQGKIKTDSGFSF